MPEPGVIKWAIIGVLILMVLVGGISLLITYWYLFILGGLGIAGAVYVMQQRKRAANRV